MEDLREVGVPNGTGQAQLELESQGQGDLPVGPAGVQGGRGRGLDLTRAVVSQKEYDSEEPRGKAAPEEVMS